jgi:hypothetical protein
MRIAECERCHRDFDMDVERYSYRNLNTRDWYSPPEHVYWCEACTEEMEAREYGDG